VRRLLAEGAEVVAVVRPGSRAPEGAEPVELDLERTDEAARAIAAARPDAVVNLAAAGAVVREADGDRLVRVNALLPYALAREVECERLVSVGSSSEYGPVDGPMSESLAPAPDDLYGAAKLAGWQLARAAAGATDTVHLRLFSVYGPGEDERRLVPWVARALLDGRPVELTPGGQVRDFVYVDDVAAAVSAALAADDLGGAVVNVGSGVETTVREACLLLADAAGADPSLLRFGARPYRDGERFSWRADTALAERLLGWRATTPLADGLRATVDALRQQ
jgi:UDP-glucose 4-epimerase